MAAIDGKYGVSIETTDEGRTTLRGFRIFQSRFDRLTERIQKGQKEKSIQTITRWAVHDGEKFRNIVQRLEDFINNLQKVTIELGLYQKHLDELRIYAEIKSLSNEEDLEILADATSHRSSSSIHQSVSDAVSRRLSVVSASIHGETRTQPRSTASARSFYTAKTQPSEYFLETVEEVDGEPSTSNITQLTSARSCAECAETGQSCYTNGGVTACSCCNINRKQCSFDNGISSGSKLEEISTFPTSVPQHERLLAESASRSLSVPLALNFDSGDEHHGDQTSAIQDANDDYWIGHVDKLALQAHQSTSTAKRMWYELRTINKAKIPFISATPIEHDLGKILASIEGPPNTPYEGGIFWIVVLASTKMPPEAPTIRFHTKIYHPNIDHRTGKLCADYQQKWHLSKLPNSMRGRMSENTTLWSQRTSPDQWTLLSLLIAICALLASPNALDPLIPEIAQKYVEDPQGYYEAAQMWTKRFASSLDKPDIASLFLEYSADPEWSNVIRPIAVKEDVEELVKPLAQSLPYLRWKYDDRYISNSVNCANMLLDGTQTSAKKTEPNKEVQDIKTKSKPDLQKTVEHYFLRDARRSNFRQMTGDTFSDLEQWRIAREIRIEIERCLYTNSFGCLDLVPKPTLLNKLRIRQMIMESVVQVTAHPEEYFRILTNSFGEAVTFDNDSSTASSRIPDFNSKYPSSSEQAYSKSQPLSRRQGHSLAHTRPTPPTATKKKSPPKPKATEADARRHRIPLGYSLKNWDPSEEPIMLLGSVFDANSIGKWIYDWTVYHHGPATPIADMAGELWLLLIQLAGKIKRAEEVMPRIRKEEHREMIDDFIESGERLTDKFKKVLKLCETPMLKASKEDPNLAQLSKNAGTNFIDALFGRTMQLERLEKVMASIRLWNLRFDANCEEIIRRPRGSSRQSNPSKAIVTPDAGEDTTLVDPKPTVSTSNRATAPFLAQNTDTSATDHLRTPNNQGNVEDAEIKDQARESIASKTEADARTSSEEAESSNFIRSTDNIAEESMWLEPEIDILLIPVVMRTAFGLENIPEEKPKYQWVSHRRTWSSLGPVSSWNKTSTSPYYGSQDKSAYSYGEINDSVHDDVVYEAF